MEWDDDSLEKDNVLLTQWHCEARDDTSENIKQFSGTVKLVVLLDERVEGLIHCLSDHLSTWHKLCVQLVQNVLQIVAFVRLLRVKELKELLDELRLHKSLKRLNIDAIVDNELKEELVDALQGWPRGVNFLLLVNTGLSES